MVEKRGFNDGKGGMMDDPKRFCGAVLGMLSGMLGGLWVACYLGYQFMERGAWWEGPLIFSLVVLTFLCGFLGIFVGLVIAGYAED